MEVATCEEELGEEGGRHGFEMVEKYSTMTETSSSLTKPG